MSRISASRCLICDGADLQPYHEGETARVEAHAFGSSRRTTAAGRIVRCLACGFAFRDPRPTPHEVATAYQGMDGEIYSSEEAGRRKTAARQLSLVRRFAGPGRLLDVGCGPGLFLAAATAAGWNGLGIEPSDRFRSEAGARLSGKARIIRGTFEESDLAANGFDVVTMWDVLEHAVDPRAFIEKSARLLRSGGHVFVNVPNLESIQARLLRSKWPLLLPEHLNYFSDRSIRLCGRLAGLEWVFGGSRPSYFSVDYICFRLAQHGMPLAGLARRALNRAGLEGIVVPAYLGERLGVWRKP